MIDYDKLDYLMELPVSEEMLGAYLEGSLPESQMHKMDLLIASNPVMEELAETSNVIIEDTQLYLNVESALEADLAMLDVQTLNLPIIDNTSILNTDIDNEIEVTAIRASEKDFCDEDFLDKVYHIGNDAIEDLVNSDYSCDSSFMENPIGSDNIDTSFELFTPNDDNFNM